MDVLLTTVPLPERHHPVLPLGLLRLRAELRRRGHDACWFDPNVPGQLDELLRALRSRRPAVVGVSMRNVDSCDSWNNRHYVPAMERLVRLVRREARDAVLVAGGSGFSLFARTLMSRLPEIDVGVRGEAETRFADLVDAGGDPSRIPGVLHRDAAGRPVEHGTAAPVDPAGLPIPAVTARELRPYTAADDQIGVETKRGCDFRCTYCTYPRLGGAIRPFPVQAVLATVEHLRGAGMRSFHVTDSIFNHPLEHAKAVCRGLIDLGWRGRWGAFVNESFVDRELLRLMKDSGCGKLDYGLDAGTDRGLRRLGKTATVRQALRAYEMTERAGLDYTVSLFLSYPGQRRRDYLAQLALAARILSRGRIVQLSNIRIYPGTALHREAVDEGMVAPDDDLLEPVFYGRPGTRLPDAAINAAERLASRLLRGRPP